MLERPADCHRCGIIPRYVVDAAVGTYQIECPKCGLSTAPVATTAEALDSWERLGAGKDHECCPACGAEPRVGTYNTGIGHPQDNSTLLLYYRVGCLRKCGVATGWEASPEDAWQCWDEFVRRVGRT